MGARFHRAVANGGYSWVTEDPIWGLGEMPFRSPTVFNWFTPLFSPPATSIEQAGLVGPEIQMTNVRSVVGYLNYIQDAIGRDAQNGPDVFSSYGPELGLANSPTDLVDRMNLILMAGQMNSTLEGEIVSAVSAIDVPPAAIRTRSTLRWHACQTAAISPWRRQTSPHKMRAPSDSRPHTASVSENGFVRLDGRHLGQPIPDGLELDGRDGAATGPPTRALVCVFLQGGNDGHGTVIATDPDSYARSRGAFGGSRTGLSSEPISCPSR